MAEGVEFVIKRVGDRRDLWMHPWGEKHGGAFEVPKDDPSLTNPGVWRDVMFNGNLPSGWTLCTKNGIKDISALMRKKLPGLTGICVGIEGAGDSCTHTVFVSYGEINQTFRYPSLYLSGMEEGFKFRLNGKGYSVPVGWSVDNWSGRDVVLDGNVGIEPRGELHVVLNAFMRRIVHTIGDEDFLLGDSELHDPPCMDHESSYLFVTMEMAMLLYGAVDLESQKIVLFGVDHRGFVTHFS